MNIKEDKKFKKINEKFILGDPISNKELVILLEFYTKLEHDLQLLGPHFHFTWREVLDRQMRLEGYKTARERMRRWKPPFKI